MTRVPRLYINKQGSHASVQDALEKSGFPVRDDLSLLKILSSLQYIHDNKDPRDWRIELKNFKDSWKCRLSKEHKT
jgi:hypothetical protein